MRSWAHCSANLSHCSLAIFSTDISRLRSKSYYLHWITNFVQAWSYRQRSIFTYCNSCERHIQRLYQLRNLALRVRLIEFTRKTWWMASDKMRSITTLTRLYWLTMVSIWDCPMRREWLTSITWFASMKSWKNRLILAFSRGILERKRACVRRNHLVRCAYYPNHRRFLCAANSTKARSIVNYSLIPITNQRGLESPSALCTFSYSCFARWLCRFNPFFLKLWEKTAIFSCQCLPCSAPFPSLCSLYCR